MSRGTVFATGLCLTLVVVSPGWCWGGRARAPWLDSAQVALGNPGGSSGTSRAGASASPDSLLSYDTQDTVRVVVAWPDTGVAAEDTTKTKVEIPWFDRLEEVPLGEKAERAALKSLWETLVRVPAVRWVGGSGALGGVESAPIRGRPSRRATLMDGGAPLGVDLNMIAPVTVDTAFALSGVDLHEEVFMDGAAGFTVVSGGRAVRKREGYLSLGRGDFGSKFNDFNYGQWKPRWWLRLDLSGASYGRASSYEAYKRDSGDFAAGAALGSGMKVTARGSRFKSRVIRYTGDKTKSTGNRLALSTAGQWGAETDWRARAYFLGGRYSYFENGPDVEDDLWTGAGGFDVWPRGRGGAHHFAVSFRRESLDRGIGAFTPPEGLEAQGTPEEGARRSSDLSGLYAIRMGSAGSGLTALLRVDRKELFGWAPTAAVRVRRDFGRAGRLAIQGARSAYMPGFMEIYGPRDEAARPTWFLASEMQPEMEWSAGADWAVDLGKWRASAGAFGARRDDVLGPPREWLGLNGEPAPALTRPMANLGEGWSVGAWGQLRWTPARWLEAGALYSAQKSEVAGERVPFQPSNKLGMWIEGERRYFGGDMRVGIVLRGFFYSSQATDLDGETLPSYGVGEGTGYVSISDVVFFYQLKNFETRVRPGPVLDLEAGEYLPLAGPEARFGLVWYLPE